MLKDDWVEGGKGDEVADGKDDEVEGGSDDELKGRKEDEGKGGREEVEIVEEWYVLGFIVFTFSRLGPHQMPSSA